MPLSLGLTLGFIGLWFLYRENLKKAKIFISASFIFIITISYLPFANLLIAPLEDSYKELTQIPQDVKHILLLGGDKEHRGWEALRLYEKIPDAKIITSGYAGHSRVTEATKTANILLGLGIPREDIIIHNEPKDTKEEALKIKEVLGDEPFILITSAYHMPRAMRYFKKSGLNPIPAPTDYKIKDSDRALSVPSGGNLVKTERALHEYIGMLWQKLRE